MNRNIIIKRIVSAALIFSLVFCLGFGAPKAVFADDGFNATFESGAESVVLNQGLTLSGEVFSEVMNGDAQFGTLLGNMGGAAFGAANMALTVHSLANDGLTSHSQGGQLVQAMVISLDLTLGMVGVAMCLGGMTAGVGFFAAAAAVGMLSAFLSSETGGQFLDNPSQWFSNFLDSGRIKPPEDTNVYKPNIYIYTDERTEFRLCFTKPELVTVSIPKYEKGWEISSEDGILSVGGSSYEYLFYEALTDKNLYSYDEAFLIPEEGRDAEFRQILSGYNFTDMEIEDFIAFWDAKLDQKAYLMYPQLTEVIDRNMPIEINTEFDEYMRVWFAFSEYEGQTFEEAQPVFFERSNCSTLLEWGGFITE